MEGVERVVLTTSTNGGADVHVLLGGCALDRQHSSHRLDLVFLVVPYERSAAEARPRVLHILQNCTWLKLLDLSVHLRAGVPQSNTTMHSACSVACFESASVASCPLHTQAALSGDERMHRFRAMFSLGSRAKAGSRMLHLSSSGLPENHSGERALVWTGTPLFLGPGLQFAWDAVLERAARWRAAGFADVHVIARGDCEELRVRGSVSCESRRALTKGDVDTLAEAGPDVSTRCLKDCNYLDQRLYNMLGLYVARAAGHTAVAFVDVDEGPRLHGADTLADTVRNLTQGTSAFFRLFRFGGDCATGYCPSDAKKLRSAVKGNTSITCSVAGHTPRWASGPGINLFKLVGHPKRLLEIKVHDALAINDGVTTVQPPQAIGACITGGLSSFRSLGVGVTA